MRKRAGAKWDEGKAVVCRPCWWRWRSNKSEININLQQYVPRDSTKDDARNYYGDKALAAAVALNASARDGVQYEHHQAQAPDGMMMWSVVKAGEQTQAAPAKATSKATSQQASGLPWWKADPRLRTVQYPWSA